MIPPADDFVTRTDVGGQSGAACKSDVFGAVGGKVVRRFAVRGVPGYGNRLIPGSHGWIRANEHVDCATRIEGQAFGFDFSDFGSTSGLYQPNAVETTVGDAGYTTGTIGGQSRSGGCAEVVVAPQNVSQVVGKSIAVGQVAGGNSATAHYQGIITVDGFRLLLGKARSIVTTDTCYIVVEAAVGACIPDHGTVRGHVVSFYDAAVVVGFV